MLAPPSVLVTVSNRNILDKSSFGSQYTRFAFSSNIDMTCVKNSLASCCRPVLNSACPFFCTKLLFYTNEVEKKKKKKKKKTRTPSNLGKKKKKHTIGTLDRRTAE